MPQSLDKHWVKIVIKLKNCLILVVFYYYRALLIIDFLLKFDLYLREA